MGLILLVGDLHLDKLTKHYPDAVKEQLKAVAASMLFEHQNIGCTYAVYLGDIAQSERLSEQASIALIVHLLEMDKLGFRQDIILGNHDYAHEGCHSLSLLIVLQESGFFNNLHVYTEPETLKIGTDRHLHFVPYPYKEGQKGCINVGHLEVAGTYRDNGSQSSSEYSPKALHWVMGHLHTKQRVRGCYYPGLLYQTTFGEPMPKGYAVIKPHSGGKFAWKWTPIAPRIRFITLEVSTKKDLSQVERAPRTHLFRLRLLDDFIPAADWVARYPNIRSISGGSVTTNTSPIEIESFDILSLQFDPIVWLRKHLVEKGFDKPSVNKAISIVKQLNL